MQNRANAPAETVQELFLCNMAVPFFDHTITEMDARFPPFTVTSSKLLCLVPSVLCSQEVDVATAVKMHKAYLPSPELINQEVKRWKLKWEGQSSELTPKLLWPGSQAMWPSAIPQHWATAETGPHSAGHIMWITDNDKIYLFGKCKTKASIWIASTA